MTRAWTHPISVTCQQCGKEFTAYRWDISHGRKFCSYQCYHQSRRQRIRRVCQQCGEVFEVQVARINYSRGIFCSPECHYTYYENKPFPGDPITRTQKQAESLRERYKSDPRFRQMAAKAAHTLWNNPDYHQTASERMKRQWQDPAFRDKRIAAVMKGSHKKPNRAELYLDVLLQELLLGEYKYVGDGQFILGGKCPDWMNVNGQKKLIELFGDYWHQGENPQERIDHYKQYGFDTLVIWEHELKELSKDKILDKVRVFQGER